MRTIRLPEAFHQQLLAYTVVAMARRTPAVASAVRQVCAEESRRLMSAIPEPTPTTAFDLFVEPQQEAAQ